MVVTLAGSPVLTGIARVSLRPSGQAARPGTPISRRRVRVELMPRTALAAAHGLTLRAFKWRQMSLSYTATKTTSTNRQRSTRRLQWSMGEEIHPTNTTCSQGHSTMVPLCQDQKTRPAVTGQIVLTARAAQLLVTLTYSATRTVQTSGTIRIRRRAAHKPTSSELAG